MEYPEKLKLKLGRSDDLGEGIPIGDTPGYGLSISPLREMHQNGF
jgi:hypothetical protein